MFIFGIIGAIGVVNAFALWCCCKVGKESDRHLDIVLKNEACLPGSKKREDD